jgi:hypothetical protein
MTFHSPSLGSNMIIQDFPSIVTLALSRHSCPFSHQHQSGGKDQESTFLLFLPAFLKIPFSLFSLNFGILLFKFYIHLVCSEVHLIKPALDEVGIIGSELEVLLG